MGSMTRAFILIAMVACLTSVAHAIAGQATFYTPPYTRMPGELTLNITGSDSTKYVSKMAKQTYFIYCASTSRKQLNDVDNNSTTTTIPNSVRRRGVLLDSHLCPLCNAAMEDVQHVFFRCDVARVVLRKICHGGNLDWHGDLFFLVLDAWFLNLRFSSRLKSILEVLFMLLVADLRLRNQLGPLNASPPNHSTIIDACFLNLFNGVLEMK
ncbi:hypothetical protein Tco_0345837 [Tanacetum coccineum]